MAFIVTSPCAAQEVSEQEAHEIGVEAYHYRTQTSVPVIGVPVYDDARPTKGMSRISKTD